MVRGLNWDGDGVPFKVPLGYTYVLAAIRCIL
jgi:hypothetical protein